MSLQAISKFLYSQLFVVPPYPKDDLTGQTIIVTGANVGLGFEAARHFTRMNAAKVILAVRTTSKGEAAQKSIEESTGKKGVIEVWTLDLSSYESVKAFANRAKGLSRLDAIVENAGIVPTKFEMFEEDESSITTNVVSTFLLALLILPKLHETAQTYNITPRLVIVSSEVHGFTELPEKSSPSILDKLAEKDAWKRDTRYNISKLLEVFYCRQLAKAMTASGKPQVTLNFVNPGLCHSELAKDPPIILVILKFLLARSTEVGSRTLVTAACANHETHGHYMSDAVVADPAPFVSSEEGVKTEKRVWDELNAKLERIQPGILANI